MGTTKSKATKSDKSEAVTSGASLHGPDALFAAGDYRAALAGYQASQLDGFEPPWGEAFRLMDQAACHLRLGERQEAQDLHIRAESAVFRSTNMFNQYAWELYERGQHQKARWLAECGLDLPWTGDYQHTANTLLQALEALGLKDEMITELAMHQLAAPSFRESQPLFTRYQKELAAFWKNPRSSAQEEGLRRHFHRITIASYEAQASAIAAVLEQDPEAWAPEVLAALDRAPLYAQVASLSAAIKDEAIARTALRRLLERWAEERITNYNAKPALRDLALGFLDDAPGLPADFSRALRSAYRKKFRESEWYLTQATTIAPLRKKLTALCKALQGHPVATSTKPVKGRSTAATKAPATKAPATKASAAGKASATAKASAARKAPATTKASASKEAQSPRKTSATKKPSAPKK